MSKIRITNSGMDRFTGHIAEMEFVDGISVNELSPSQIRRISAIYLAESVESGLQTGDNAEWERNKAKAVIEIKPKEELVTTVEIDESVVIPSYTEEELIAIADKKGIIGIREIASKYEIKGNSVEGLISKLLSYKHEQELKAKIVVRR